MKKACEVKFTNKTLSDLKELPDYIRKECFVKLNELEKNIHMGKALTNIGGINLEGYYSIYVYKAKYRIVYEKKDNVYEVTNISVVDNPRADLIAIGERNNKEVYKEAFKRILEKK